MKTIEELLQEATQKIQDVKDSSSLWISAMRAVQKKDRIRKDRYHFARA